MRYRRHRGGRSRFHRGGRRRFGIRRGGHRRGSRLLRIGYRM